MKWFCQSKMGKKVIKRVWVSKKKMKSLEKRIADLEGQIQSQQKGIPIEDLKDIVLERLQSSQERQQNITWTLSVKSQDLEKH